MQQPHAPRARRLTGVSLLLAAMVSGLAACGNGDDEAASPPSEAALCAVPPVASGPGGRILAIADTDMLATAYVDDQLGPPAGASDNLFVLNPAATTPAITGRVAVSNAVTGPVWVFDTNAAGSRAYVIETNTPPPAGVTTLTGLSRQGQGTALSVLDVCNANALRQVGRVNTVNTPLTVSLRPDGRTLAVSSRFPARLVTHAVTGDAIGPAVDVPVPEAIRPPADAPDQEITQAQWSPDGRWLAVSVRASRKVQFYAASGPTEAPTLTPSGPAVDIDQGSFGGRWSPDGRYFYVTNVRNLAVTASQLQALLAQLPTLTPAQITELLRGSVQVIDVFGAAGASGPAAPRLVQTLPSPAFPEGMALSPDGRLLATVNMQTTSLPRNLPLYSPLSTVSLYARDPATGQLTRIADVPFEGILPEGVDFDPTGRYLAVAVFHPADADRTRGAVDVWRVESANGAPSGLTRVSRTLADRGVHFLKWLP